MLSIYVIDGLLLRLLDNGAGRLLRLLGGPQQMPQRNEDFVWF